MTATPQSEGARDRAVLETVRALTDGPCRECGATMCGHAAVLSLVLGYRNQPRCGTCLARELAETPAALAERALQWIRRRDCFMTGWQWASAREGHAGHLRPPCLWGEPVALDPAPAAGEPPPNADATWDAGDLGCGDLVLELRERLRALPGGAVLRLLALDPGAPEDIPAWCGLTGHVLLTARHPVYWIRRKPDGNEPGDRR